MKTSAAAGSLLLAGVCAGAVVAPSGAATATDSTASSSRSSTSSRKGHRDEKTLTGATADNVKAAALAKYPGATINRLETGSDGVNEAHLTTKAGDEIDGHRSGVWNSGCFTVQR